MSMTTVVLQCNCKRALLIAAFLIIFFISATVPIAARIMKTGKAAAVDAPPLRLNINNRMNNNIDHNDDSFIPKEDEYQLDDEGDHDQLVVMDYSSARKKPPIHN
ncbi:hypothetical protein BVC80_27g5 [Macleaya cordata]|uniref:Uncharacterized protein n=1 Tax=Macleaya cordata TaxID=56857 RepID=A0A200QFA6_MACCD|nr:hypothetical protein BVC80_27g5 [Macleaya cordata]